MKPTRHRRSSSLPRMVLITGCVIAMCAAACGKKDKDKGGDKKGGGDEYVHKCKIFIKQKSDAKPIKGKVAKGLEDEAAAKKEALKNACDQLPEAERAKCPDKSKYTVQWVSASMTANGKKFHSPNVTLKPKLAEHKGKASAGSREEACKAATAAACKAAGAGPDCIKSGKFEQTGISASKQLEM